MEHCSLGEFEASRAPDHDPFNRLSDIGHQALAH
jgi:hypothetical protein